MPGVSTKHDGTIATLKTIGIVFLIFVAASHTLRFLAGRYGGGGGGGDIASFGSNTVGFVLSGMDDFRRDCGDVVGGLQRACPASVSKPCAKGVYGLKVVLGLH